MNVIELITAIANTKNPEAFDFVYNTDNWSPENLDKVEDALNQTVATLLETAIDLFDQFKNDKIDGVSALELILKQDFIQQEISLWEGARLVLDERNGIELLNSSPNYDWITARLRTKKQELFALAETLNNYGSIKANSYVVEENTEEL